MGHNHAHHHHKNPKNPKEHAHPHQLLHRHLPKDFGRAFLFGIVLNLGFVAIEAFFGWWADSLSLLADAGHNLSDVAGLGLAWWATLLAKRAPTSRWTYGMRRSSILAALGNAVLLLLAVGGIAWESISRLTSPITAINSNVMIGVAAVGILINIMTALLFLSGQKEDINIRGAFLHMMADALVSLGVVISGFILKFTGWHWLDSVTSLLIALVILIGTWQLLKESLNLALDGVPTHINFDEIETYLKNHPEVHSVHDLHIWNVSTTDIALTVHLVLKNNVLNDKFLFELNQNLNTHFGIGHATIQLESGDESYPCHQVKIHGF